MMQLIGIPGSAVNVYGCKSTYGKYEKGQSLTVASVAASGLGTDVWTLQFNQITDVLRVGGPWRDANRDIAGC